VAAREKIVMSPVNKILVATVLALAGGFGIYQSRRAAEGQARLLAVQEQSAPLARQMEQLTHERDQAGNQLTILRNEVERLNQNTPELLRLRGEVAHLRQSALELSNHLAGATRTRLTHEVTPAAIELSSSYLETSSVSRTFSPQDHVPQPGEAQQSKIYGSPTNGALLIAWRKHWYPAEILETRNDQHLIRYTGYGSNWDEWVGAERMAIYDAEQQAAQR